MQWLTDNPILAGVIGLLAIAAIAFVWDARRKGLTLPQEAAALAGSKTGQTLSADATAIIAATKAEFTTLHAKVNAALAASSGAGQLQVGQVAFDQWDAVGPFWSSTKQINLDDKMLRTGDQPPVVFKSQPATTAGNVPVARMS